MIIVISSPSGVGKTTVSKRLEKNNFDRIITYTSRPMRPQEKNHVDYHFVEKTMFNDLVKKDFFIEYSFVHGNYYGISNESLGSNSKHKILTIDVQGAQKIKKIKPEVVFIFLLPPSFEEWMRRINVTERNNFDIRLENAIKELDAAKNFDYVIVNHSIEDTIRKVQSITVCEEAKNYRNIENLINELKLNINKRRIDGKNG